MTIPSHTTHIGTSGFGNERHCRYRGPVSIDIRRLNALIGKEIKGAYTARDLTLEAIAAGANIPYGTLRKKIAGTSPVFATELLVIVGVIYPEKDAEAIAVEAGAILDRAAARLSAATATNDDLQKMREKQEQARAMPPEALEDQERRAATTDPELSSDEPGSP
jgi:hypothetical protein